MYHLWLLLILPSVLGLPVLPDINGGPNDVWTNPDSGVIGGPDDMGPIDPDANPGHDLWPDIPYPDRPEGPLDYFTRKNQTEPRLILSKTQIGNANAYVDEVLVNVAKLIQEKGYDPYTLPEKTLSWEHSIFFVTISVVASLYNGHLAGLSGIQRRGDVTLEAISDRLIVTANLGTKLLEAGYNMKAQFMGVGPNCSVSINIEDPEIMVRIQIPVNKDDPELSYFHITNLGKVKWHFSCGTLVDYFMPIVETGANFIANLVKNMVASLLEVVLKDFIEQQIVSVVAEIIN